LPAGIALDTTTGRISGTPTSPERGKAYTVTATNAGGNTTFALTLSVAGERSTTDRADKSGRRMHVTYALPAGGFDSVDKVYLVYHVGNGAGCSVARATVAPSCFLVKT
jgi:hypothetical protein